MTALLVRVGVDQAYGRWNAPVDADGNFVYVPIPERRGTKFQPGLERRYDDVIPGLRRFCKEHGCDLRDGLGFPDQLLEYSMHLDPDFEHLTYGDNGDRRGAGMADMAEDDLLVFYAGMRPVHPCEHRLLYAVIGVFVVDSVVRIHEVPKSKWHQNAHTRKLKHGEPDIIVRGKRGRSGRFDRAISIGEWRSGAYRVRKDVLDAWGGLSVKDGFIQRSAVPPAFSRPERFVRWLEHQHVRLVARNEA